jgi:branched-subunit amino acid transport protein
LEIGWFVEKSKKDVIVKLFSMGMDQMKFLDHIFTSKKLLLRKSLSMKVEDFLQISISMMFFALIAPSALMVWRPELHFWINSLFRLPGQLQLSGG